MNQILMAAARGARVQAELDIQTSCQCIHCGGLNKFGRVERITLTDNMLLAIHPDDDHLRFGPISTELREWAKETHVPLIGNFYQRAAKEYLLSNLPAGNPPSVEQRQLFLLILSECLAEEGL